MHVMRDTSLSRRQAIGALSVASAAGALNAEPQDLEAIALTRSDHEVTSLIKRQITDSQSRWCGGMPSPRGVSEAVFSGMFLNSLTPAFLHPRSKYYKNNLLVERMKLAIGFLERNQSPMGLINLHTTNFSSPPDTGFAVHGAAAAACLAHRAGDRELFRMIEPFLRKAGPGIAAGGIHTPNHRWVVCSALAQINEILPDPSYVRRIDRWLMEGIDIDSEGQYTERSSGRYNAVVNHALCVMALKLNRPELLDPVRRNLHATLYFLHPNFEVVTEISRRQDRDRRTGLEYRSFFPLRLLAVRDGNGQFATLADHMAPEAASLSELMEYPELLKPGPPLQPVPDNYQKIYPLNKVARIRRGLTSATILLGDSAYLLCLRRGDAVVQAVRMTSTFFGKGEFVPSIASTRNDSYYLSQQIEGGYMQPLEPPLRVTPENWDKTRLQRREFPVFQIQYSATITELKNGFQMQLSAKGTDEVPLAVEIGFREGGSLEGCIPAPDVAAGGYILASGYGVYKSGANAIRFGPGRGEHAWTQLHTKTPKLPGDSVYLTALTPFEHTLTFEWA